MQNQDKEKHTGSEIECLAGLFEGAFHKLADPVCLLTAQSRTLFRNAAAQDLIQAGVALREADGAVFPVRRAEVSRWKQALSRVCASGETMIFAFGRADGRPMIASLAPCAPEGARHGEARSAILAIFCDTRPSEAAACILEEGFQLTPAEAQIAAALASGRDVVRIAQDRGVVASTVRTQLRSIMGKLGVRRQTDLVLLVACLRPRIRREK